MRLFLISTFEGLVGPRHLQAALLDRGIDRLLVALVQAFGM